MKRIKIGADPEFCILTPTNKLLNARHICLDGNKRKKFGRENVAFELRPDPSYNIFVIIANIRHLLVNTINKYPILKKCKFIAGHCVVDQPIGGHIHFEMDGDGELNDKLFKYFIDKVLYRGLAEIIDDKPGLRMRRKYEYGKRRDFRNDNGVSIEYRSSISWLYSPSVAFIYLTLAKICGLLYLNRYKFNINIDTINNTKRSGRILLRRIITLVECQYELMEEKDIYKCVALIKRLPTVVNINWSKDFKSNWQI